MQSIFYSCVHHVFDRGTDGRRKDVRRHANVVESPRDRTATSSCHTKYRAEHRQLLKKKKSLQDGGNSFWAI